MTRPRLFPEPRTTSDSDDPNKRFDALAAKVFTVSKDEIDKREKDWRKQKRKKR